MALANKNVIFVSHASRDRKIVSTFVECFLSRTMLDHKEVQYTSSEKPDSPGLLDPGASVWVQLRDNLERTCCFIACLSKDYFRSNWCIAELAVYHELMRNSKAKGRAPILLVVDPDCPDVTKNPFVQGRLLSQLWDYESTAKVTAALKKRNILKATAKVPHKDSLETLIKMLGSSYSDFFVSTDPPHLKFDLLVKRLMVERKQSETGLTELAQQHFAHPPKGPLTSIVERSDYEQISVNMANRARWKLLWTLFKSPLLVADAYKYEDRLMPYDRRFERFQPMRKIRLVIFDDTKAAKAYAELDIQYHKRRLSDKGIKVPGLIKDLLQERREAFERSSTSRGGFLYFTKCESDWLAFPGARKPGFKNSDSLEFAYSDFDHATETCLLMESGFNSEFSFRYADGKHEKASQQFRHVTFYSAPKKECSDAIKTLAPYKELLGHLDNLQTIADALFKAEPDPKVFVKSDKISALYCTE